MSVSSRLAAAAFCAATLAALAAPRPASACGNSFYHERREETPDQAALRIARAALQGGKHQAAYDKGVELAKSSDPKMSKWGHRIAGVAALKLKRFAESASELSVALDKFDGEPYLAAKLGEAEVGQGKNDAALKRLDALDKDGLIGEADTYVALAKARLAAGERDRALDAVNKALAQTPAHAEALAMKKDLTAKPTPVSKPKADPALKS